MDDFMNEGKRSRKILVQAKLKGCTRLNVRSGPSADSTVNGIIHTSNRIKIDATTKDHEWVCVYEPVYGYAKKEFLEVK